MLRRRLTGRDRGVSSLELAFIAPSLILLIFFVIQAALYFYARSVAQNAAREGVSQLRLDQTVAACQGNMTAIQHDVEAFARNIGSGALEDVQASPVCSKDGRTVTIEVTGHAISLTGITMTIDQTVTGQVEHFQDLP
jgi:Flp pilus assembly protein TadG